MKRFFRYLFLVPIPFIIWRIVYHIEKYNYVTSANSCVNIFGTTVKCTGGAELFAILIYFIVIGGLFWMILVTKENKK